MSDRTLVAVILGSAIAGVWLDHHVIGKVLQIAAVLGTVFGLIRSVLAFPDK